MKLGVAVWVILALLFLSAAGARETRPPTEDWTTVVNLVSEIFFDTRSSGSVTVRGICGFTLDGDGVVSDRISNPPKGPFNNVAEAFTALTQLNPHLSWKRDRDGLVRVSDDRVAGELLRVRLESVRFDRVVLPHVAVRAIMSAPEVRRFLDSNRIESFPDLPHAGPTSTEGFPELTADLHDVTVAQALDRVARFFGGTWYYSECADGALRRLHVRAEVGTAPVEATGKGR